MYNVSTMFNAAIVANQDQRLLIKWGDNAILTAEDISATDGGLKYTEYANPDEDLTIGQAVQSALELYLLNADGKAGMLVQSKGKTLFTALLGVKLVGAASDTGQDVATGATLAVVLNNGGSNKIAVSANPSWGYIIRNGVQIAVSGAVHALAAMNGHLYLIGSGGAILGQYAYSSDAATLTAETAVTPEEITKDKLDRWASAHKCATLEELKAYDFTISGGNIMAERWEYAPLGNFIAEKPSKTQDDIITVSAYDQMSLFDRDATSFISGLTFPLTLTQLFVKLCEYVKIGYKSGTLINGSVSYSASTFIADGYTLRDILSFIAEAAGGFARISRDGAAEIAWFASSGRTIGKKQRFSLDLAEYTTKAVGGISIKNTNSDAVCTYPVEIADDAQIYTTVDNPLLVAPTVAEMQTRAQPVFNRLSAVSAYRPAAVECVSNWAVQAGDLISIEADDGDYYTVPIFTQSISWAGFATAEMEATGSETRGIDAEKNQAVRDGKRLYESGKEINALAERVSTAETSITQNAEQIALRATKTEVTSSVDGIQVGGTNLIPGTADWKYTITSTTPASLVVKRVYLFESGGAEVKQLKGKPVTMSYTISNAGTGAAYSDAPSYGPNRFGGYLHAEWIDGTGNASGVKSTFPFADYVEDKGDLRRVQYIETLTPPAGYDTLYALSFFMELNCHPTDENEVWIFARPKVELGNKATDWSPAPEDAENRISTAETQIAQNATEISLRATKTELDGLQIGGVNLMLDTKAYGGNGGANYTIVGALQTETYNGFAVRRGENTSDANALQFKMAYAFQPGESYTLSFWAKGSGAAQALITGYTYPCTSVSSEGTAGTDAGGANTFNVTSDWKRYWITFTMGNWATVPTGKELWLRARTQNGSGNVLDVCGLKLERGSRATDWSPSPEDPARSVKTSSVTVNAEGIWLDSTGEISLAAGGKINIQSGADEGNQILLGDLFSATDQGGVTGKTANFGSLLVGGNPAAALGGNIVVATAQPSGNGILWLKPNSVATVQYQRATPSTRSWWLEGTRVIESIAAKTTDVLPGGTIHYKLTLPLYALSRLEGVVVAPKLTKSGISGEVALGAQTISILGLNVLTLEGESAINLGAAPGTPITLTLDVTNGDGQKLFVQSDTTIQLEISNRTMAAGGVQALEAYWIP